MHVDEGDITSPAHHGSIPLHTPNVNTPSQPSPPAVAYLPNSLAPQASPGPSQASQASAVTHLTPPAPSQQHPTTPAVTHLTHIHIPTLPILATSPRLLAKAWQPFKWGNFTSDVNQPRRRRDGVYATDYNRQHQGVSDVARILYASLRQQAPSRTWEELPNFPAAISLDAAGIP